MSMDTEQLKTLAVRVAALADALDERSQQAVQAVSNSGERLDQTARLLSQNVQRLASEAARSVGAEAHTAVTQGMQQAFDQCALELQQAAGQATQAVHALQAQNAALRQAQSGLLWRASWAVVLGAVLAAGTSGFWFWKSTQAARSAEFSQSIWRATRAGTLTQCGDQLCVKLPRNAPRYPGNGDYVLLP